MKTEDGAALDKGSIFIRQYSAETTEGEVEFSHLDDLLEFIQGEMLTAFEDKEILVTLHRIEGNKDGKSV